MFWPCMKNSFWLAIQFIATTLASLVTLKLNLLTFGAELFGIWIVISSYWIAIYAFNFGINTALSIHIAEKTRDNVSETSSVRNIIVVSLLCAVFWAGGLYFGMRWVVDLLLKGSSLQVIHEQRLATLTSFLGLVGYGNFLLYTINGVFEGLRKFPLVSKVFIVRHVITIAATFYVYVKETDIIFLATAHLVITGAILLFSIVLLQYATGFVSLPRDFSELRQVLKIGTPIQFALILGFFSDPIIKFFIGRYSSFDTVTYYEIARRFATAISGFFTTTFRNLITSAAIYDFHSYVQHQLADAIALSKIYIGLVYSFGICLVWGFVTYYFKIEEQFFIVLLVCLPEVINIALFSFYVTLAGKKQTLLLMGMQGINFTIIVLTFAVGYSATSSPFVLIGLFLAVLISDNLLWVIYLKKYKVNILTRYGHFHVKYLLLSLVVIGGIFLAYTGAIKMSVGVIASFSLLLYSRDMFVHIPYFYNKVSKAVQRG